MKTQIFLFKSIFSISLFVLFLVSPTVKLHSQIAPETKSFDNILKFTMSGNSYSDQTFVVVVPGSTFGFDSEYDAYKLFGIIEAPQFYSIIPCCILSVNAIPEFYTNMKVQMGYKVGNNTTYTIEAENLYTFGSDTNIVLVDTKENVVIDLMVDSVYTFYGETTDDIERFELYFNYPMKLDLTVMLEGPYNGSTMNTSLNSEGLLPLNHPFNTSPWNYSGTESVVSIPNANIVDWVLLEMRNAPDAASAIAATMVEQQACFLQNDGSIVGLDGSSFPEFTAPVSEEAFIVIMTRNHLAVMSANALIRTGGVYPYDFSNSTTQAYGSGAQKDLGGGVYGMFGGDANADGIVDNDDKISFWSLLAGKGGYLSADYTYDGQINNPDKNQVWVVNEGINSQVP